MKKHFIDLNKRARDLELQEQRKTVMRHRLKNGFLVFGKQPWKLTFPLLLTTLSFLVWCNRSSIPLPGGSSKFPDLVILWETTVVLLAAILSIFLFFSLLIKFGIPEDAKDIEARLVHIELLDSFGIGPSLLSIQKIGQTVERMTFYSRGIGKEKWQEKQGDIEGVLERHLIGDIQYGKTQHYIVLTVAPGISSNRDEPLYDDEL